MFTDFPCYDGFAVDGKTKNRKDRGEGFSHKKRRRKTFEVTKSQNGALIYGLSPADPYVRSAKLRTTESEYRILPASLRDEQGLCPCAASRLSPFRQCLPTATRNKNLKAVKAAQNEPKSPSLNLLLLDYLTKRNAGAYSDKAKSNNLKKVSQDIVYLEEHDLYTLDDLQSITDQFWEKLNGLHRKMKANEKRQKKLKELIAAAENYQRTKAVVDKLKEIHFNKRREQYRKDHEMDFNIHFAAKRTLERLLTDNSDKTMHVGSWKEEAERLSAEYAVDYEELKKQREESKELFRIQAEIDSVLRDQQKQGQNKNDLTRL